jgi:hypothetical protein
MHRGWMSIAKYELDDEASLFCILRKTDRQWVSPEDFLPVLEGMRISCIYMHKSANEYGVLDVILNHPGLQFLGDNPMFQERYSKASI